MRETLLREMTAGHPGEARPVSRDRGQGIRHAGNLALRPWASVRCGLSLSALVGWFMYLFLFFNY